MPSGSTLRASPEASSWGSRKSFSISVAIYLGRWSILLTSLGVIPNHLQKAYLWCLWVKYMTSRSSCEGFSQPILIAKALMSSESDPQSSGLPPESMMMEIILDVVGKIRYIVLGCC